MAFHTWVRYLVAAVGLSLIPGPNSLPALTHGAPHGHRRNLFTVSGGSLWFVVLIALSMAGTGTVLQAPVSALTLLNNWIGGGGLIWPGIQFWRAPDVQLHADASMQDAAGAALFGKGFLAAVSNPKWLLFNGAFLPRFIDPGRDLLGQITAMGVALPTTK